MGAATIIEKSLSENSQAFWNKVGPKVPELNIDTSKYSKGFVNFAMIVGLYATVKVGVAGFKKLNKSLKVNKALIGQKFRQKYGEGSWAVIADVKRNEGYCTYLAKQGINLVLMGDEEDINIARDMVMVENDSVRVVQYPVNWEDKDFDYQKFTQAMKAFDISFLVLPKVKAVGAPKSYGTHVEEIPAFQHYFLLVRYLGEQLQWRAETSAIILPSTQNLDQIITGHGVTEGINSALDGFMRCLNFQPQFPIQVISARGTVQQCFKDLGKQSVSE